MSKIYKVLKGCVCLLIIISFSGCTHLNSEVPFSYEPSSVAVSKSINKTVGFNLILDKRPESDVACTNMIKNISEKVTVKIIEDFDRSKIFKEIYFPPQGNEDIIINGTLNRFMWKKHVWEWEYIPGIDLLLEIMGVPGSTFYATVDITLELKNAKSGVTLGIFRESSMITRSVNLYTNPLPQNVGGELSDAFRDVVKKLKCDLLKKIK